MSQARFAHRLLANSRGQTMAEYALILATIAAIAVALVQTAGSHISVLVNDVINLF